MHDFLRILPRYVPALRGLGTPPTKTVFLKNRKKSNFVKMWAALRNVEVEAKRIRITAFGNSIKSTELGVTKSGGFSNE
jgi:hypothetical protein